MSDEIIVTDVLSPNSAKYAAGRVPRPNVMAVALRNLQHAGVPNLTRDFLQKPFPLRSLAGKIREVLGQPGMARAASAAGAG
jgi:hypothetical protein